MVSKVITAKDFFDAFTEEVTEKEYYKEHKDNKEFTKNVIGKAMKTIFTDKKYGFEYNYYAEGISSGIEAKHNHGEFYRIDFTAFDNRIENQKDDESNKTDRFGFNPHSWKLVAAVEHENNAKDWNYEVLKLAPICCPLRVVVGYSNRIIPDLCKLEYIAQLLRENDVCIYGEFLVIIGAIRTPKQKKRGECIKADYRGYLYEDEKFVFKYEMKKSEATSLNTKCDE